MIGANFFTGRGKVLEVARVSDPAKILPEVIQTRILFIIN